jgi:cytochrome c
MSMNIPMATLAARRTPVAIMLCAFCMSTSACDHGRTEREAAALAHGSPERGKDLTKAYGCGSCHTIPGIVGADATVGPPLAGIAGRSYIAGVLTNEPDHMVRWLVDPPAVDSLTAMPRLGLTPRDARDVAAYLYTLR